MRVHNYLLVVLIACILSISAIAIEENKVQLSKTNKQLDGLLEKYKNGTIDPDEEVPLVIHFKDQKQNIEAQKIKAKYEKQKRVHRERIKEILKMRKSEVIKEHNHNQLHLSTAEERKIEHEIQLTKSDISQISQSTKAIEKLEIKARKESIGVISKEILRKQEPFINLIKEKGGKVLHQLKAYNGMVVRGFGTKLV